jgi:hypothetical protein
MSKQNNRVITRKSQLIHTFGVAAMQVSKSGTALITGGLDNWYTTGGTIEKLPDTVTNRYRINDHRLQEKLQVDFFMEPPDAKINADDTRFDSPIHAKRFPYYHVCSRSTCQALQKISPIEDNDVTCKKCGSPLYQSRFVAVCPDGHMQDFPWFDWLNHKANATCSEDDCVLKLTGTGGTSSADVYLQCTKHSGVRASLSKLFNFEKEGQSITSSSLFEMEISCSGSMPWFGNDSRASGCDAPLVGALRQSSNIYFSKTMSSILISQADEGLADIASCYASLDKAKRTLIDSATDVDTKVQFMLMALEGGESARIRKFFTELEAVGNGSELSGELDYRYTEFVELNKNSSQGVLVCKALPLADYAQFMSEYFSGISEVKELVVTNAFYGFDRLQQRNDRTLESYKKQLWKYSGPSNNWLPAVKSYGEGIFIQFSNAKIKAWSEVFRETPAFQVLKKKVMNNAMFESCGTLTAEYVLIHTFSHLLINQLIIECGYSTASLRERLYVRPDHSREMYAVLLYTAAGDSEGSLGGLVRMASKGYLERSIKRAVDSSNWCSSDPVCREVGQAGGQGPGGMNIAACHNCALLPETSCEMFNSLLDRGAVTSPQLNGVGYFDGLLSEGLDGR